MSFHWDPREQVRIVRYLFKWTFLASIVGVCAGTASAVFLLSLEFATETRLEQPWLLYLLPVGGLFVGVLYHYWGKDCERGNNLILEEIHDPKKGVSGRMAPMILLGTVVTHLSADRQGVKEPLCKWAAAWRDGSRGNSVSTNSTRACCSWRASVPASGPSLEHRSPAWCLAWKSWQSGGCATTP